MTVSEGKKHALLLLLKGAQRRRRNPILRYLLPDISSLQLGLLALCVMLIASSMYMPRMFGSMITTLGVLLGGAVYLRAMFRTTFDEKREFIKAAAKLDVPAEEAGAFYDEYAKSGALI